MLAHVVTFFKDDSGVTVVEYGLLVALISVAIIAALTSLGGSLSDFFTAVGTALTTAGG